MLEEERAGSEGDFGEEGLDVGAAGGERREGCAVDAREEAGDGGAGLVYALVDTQHQKCRETQRWS